MHQVNAVTRWFRMEILAENIDSLSRCQTEIDELYSNEWYTLSVKQRTMQQSLKPAQKTVV